jgi:hypothetical protein
MTVAHLCITKSYVPADACHKYADRCARANGFIPMLIARDVMAHRARTDVSVLSGS